MVEAVKSFKLQFTSMPYMNKVLEHLHLLWIGIWLHTHTVTTTDISPDWGDLAESLGIDEEGIMQRRRRHKRV
jgi:hypothetical protein